MRMINLENNFKVLELIKLNISDMSWSIGENFNHFFNSEPKFDNDKDLIAISQKLNACIWLKASNEGIKVYGIRDIYGNILDSNTFDLVLNSFLDLCINEIKACAEVPFLIDEDNDNLTII